LVWLNTRQQYTKKNTNAKTYLPPTRSQVVHDREMGGGCFLFAGCQALIWDKLIANCPEI
jgi:hypothetical protein